MPAVPDKYFDGTNPILTIVGDEPTERDVSMTNNASIVKTELLTNTQLPPGQTVLVRVKGDMAFDQIMSNLEQINAFDGFEVIGVTNVPVEEGPNSPSFSFVNGEFVGEKIAYTGGEMNILSNDAPAFAVTTQLVKGKSYAFTMPSYSINGVNVFTDVGLYISQHSDPATAWNSKNDSIGGYAIDTTTGGAQGGISVNKAGQGYIFQKNGSALQLTAKVVDDAVEWSIYDRQNGGETVEYEDSQPGIQNSTLYCHVIALLNADEVSKLFTSEITVPVGLHGMELS